jgi:hypothetical protein
VTTTLRQFPCQRNPRHSHAPAGVSLGTGKRHFRLLLSHEETAQSPAIFTLSYSPNATKPPQSPANQGVSLGAAGKSDPFRLEVEA